MLDTDDGQLTDAKNWELKAEKSEDTREVSAQGRAGERGREKEREKGRNPKSQHFCKEQESWREDLIVIAQLK